LTQPWDFAQALVVDDECPDDLVVQALAVRVPQAPQVIYQPNPAEEPCDRLRGSPRECTAPSESVTV
jgi:hypothetical protein